MEFSVKVNNNKTQDSLNQILRAVGKQAAYHEIKVEVLEFGMVYHVEAVGMNTTDEKTLREYLGALRHHCTVQ